MKKVIIRKSNFPVQEEYKHVHGVQGELYYYVHYSNRPDKEGKFQVFTNKLIFEETRIIYESEDKELVIKHAYAINNAYRLLGGYYDNSPDRDTRFPIIP